MPRNIDMITAPHVNLPTATAATDPTKAAATPRIKLSSHGFSIDHPDPELGEQLLANALGVADRDAMHGILRQLVKASVSGERPDEVARWMFKRRTISRHVVVEAKIVREANLALSQ